MLVISGYYPDLVCRLHAQIKLMRYPTILRGHTIESEDLVTLLSAGELGVTIDYKLSFENHIQELCQRVFVQLNALKLLGYFVEPKIH